MNLGHFYMTNAVGILQRPSQNLALGLNFTNKTNVVSGVSREVFFRPVGFFL